MDELTKQFNCSYGVATRVWINSHDMLIALWPNEDNDSMFIDIWKVTFNV